jgi:hypothetical protein
MLSDGTVSEAKEFYESADEHFGWAETAKTERERAIFLQMAAAWLEVAQRGRLPSLAPHAVSLLAAKRRQSLLSPEATKPLWPTPERPSGERGSVVTGPIRTADQAVAQR